MSINISFSLEQLAAYILQKQSLIDEYKGINYSHAIAICRSMIYFQDSESLHARMRSYSSSLLDSLLKNNLIYQAPFISGNLTYVNIDVLPFFYRAYDKESVEYKSQHSRAVLDFIKSEKTTTRQKIIERFELRREQVMDILTELRANFQIFMSLTANRWTISAPESVLSNTELSRSSAVTELVFEAIKAFGPITVPQIMAMLELSGGKISTSLIELYENNRVIRGQFIENSSYESFIVSEEQEYIHQYKEHLSKQKTTDISIQILPSTDSFAVYWKSADFMPLEEVRKVLVLASGLPVCSFDYKIIDENFHVLELRKTALYSSLEQEIAAKIKEFAENRGKIAILPKLQDEVIQLQSQSFAETLIKRGYNPRSSGLIHNFSSISTSEGYSNLVSWQDLFPLLLENQHLTRQSQFDSKSAILNAMGDIGLPLPLYSLYARTSYYKRHLINELLTNRQVVLSKFGGFSRGVISTVDYGVYSKLGTTKRLSVLEDRVFRYIKQKGKSTFDQLSTGLHLSNRVLLSAVTKLESSHQIVQTKTLSGKVVWMPVTSFIGKTKIKQVLSSREGWLEVILRILSSNLPLSVIQLANITGLSNTQVELYLKELIASKGVRSGRYIEEVRDAQYTTKENEEELVAYLYELEEKRGLPEDMEIVYLPHNDPLIILYRTYLLERFRTKSILTRSTPSEYGELILANGKPMALVQYKRENKVEFINNIEVLPEYTDNHSIMLLLTAIHDYRQKIKAKGKTHVLIKQVNNISLLSPTGRDIVRLIKDMKLHLDPI